MILLVDDDAQIRGFLAEALASSYRVQVASNGREALTILDRVPDLAMVLTDVMMPVMDGLSLLSAVRARSSILPVVVMTAHDQRSDVLAALRAGAYDFLTKPFELDMIEAAVQRAVDHHTYQLLLRNEHELRAAVATALRAAHEINNPLTVIKSIVEYHLSQGSLSPELRDDLNMINGVVDSLAAQIRLLPRIRQVIVAESYGSPMLDLDRAMKPGSDLQTPGTE